MTQQPEQPAARQNVPRDLLSRLYREIGISAVAAALESNKTQKAPQIHAGQNPAVIREEKAA
ncbi:MAG: hypothetical protein WDN46_14505 [Methylocella sp.]